jgi:hypothetical protein
MGALTLATRQGVQPALRSAEQPTQLQRVGHHLAVVRTRTTALVGHAAEAHVVVHAQAQIGVFGLADCGHLVRVGSRVRSCTWMGMARHFTHVDTARRVLHTSADESQQAALTCAVWPDDGAAFTGTNRQVDTLQQRHALRSAKLHTFQLNRCTTHATPQKRRLSDSSTLRGAPSRIWSG